VARGAAGGWCRGGAGEGVLRRESPCIVPRSSSQSDASWRTALVSRTSQIASGSLESVSTDPCGSSPQSTPHQRSHSGPGVFHDHNRGPGARARAGGGGGGRGGGGGGRRCCRCFKDEPSKYTPHHSLPQKSAALSCMSFPGYPLRPSPKRATKHTHTSPRALARIKKPARFAIGSYSEASDLILLS
jgi:hypothetical protein